MEQVGKTKRLGGLGVGSIYMKILGLLLKWWWRFCENDDTLWKRVTKSVHGLSSPFLSLETIQKVKHGLISEIYNASLARSLV